jgi:hypothetical protein
MVLERMAAHDAMNEMAKPHLLGMVAGLFLAAGLVLSACVATTAWFKVKTAQSISVKGSARKNVRADLMIWKGSFTMQAPEFIYTKAGEAKVEMLAEATRDARTRAEQSATQGGRGIGGLQAADMGVIQITPIYCGQTSWEGMNDTSSLDKTITAVVTATFALK